MPRNALFPGVESEIEAVPVLATAGGEKASPITRRFESVGFDRLCQPTGSPADLN
jgi:hypothetical protein